MDVIGISVQLCKYRAVVHYESCPYYRDTYHHSKLPLPPSIKWKLCSYCKPAAEDIVEVAGEVTWLEKYGDAMSRLVNLSAYDDEAAERISTNALLNGGRTLPKKRQYFD